MFLIYRLTGGLIIIRTVMTSVTEEETMDDRVNDSLLHGKLQPRCSISQFIRRIAFVVYRAAFFLEGRQSQVRISFLSLHSNNRRYLLFEMVICSDSK